MGAGTHANEQGSYSYALSYAIPGLAQARHVHAPEPLVARDTLLVPLHTLPALTQLPAQIILLTSVEFRVQLDRVVLCAPVIVNEPSVGALP